MTPTLWFKQFYVLLDQGVLSLVVLALCGLVTLVHVVWRLVPPGRGRGVVAVGLALLLAAGGVGVWRFGVARAERAILLQLGPLLPDRWPRFARQIAAGDHDPLLLETYGNHLIAEVGASATLAFLATLPSAVQGRVGLQVVACRATMLAGRLAEGIALARQVVTRPQADSYTYWAYHTLMYGYLNLGDPGAAIAVLEEQLGRVEGSDARRILLQRIAVIRAGMLATATASLSALLPGPGMASPAVAVAPAVAAASPSDPPALPPVASPAVGPVVPPATPPAALPPDRGGR